MSIVYSRIVKQDLEQGHGTVRVTMPDGGEAVGDKIGHHTFCPGVFCVTDFGAVGDGTADDAAAFQAAIDAAEAYPNGTVYVPPNTYQIGTGLTMAGFVNMVAPAGFESILRKAANIDMITISGNAVELHNLRLKGVGGTYTGRGIAVTSGNDQQFIGCVVEDMNGYCLEYTADSVGIRSQVRGGNYNRTTLTDPSIKLPGTASETTGDRMFIGVVSSGGVLIDLSGGNNTIIIGCDIANITFGDNSKKAAIVGNRIATGGSNLDVKGEEHTIVGNIVGGSIVLNANTELCHVGENVVASGNLDSSTKGNNYIELEADFTPEWTAASSAPAIGNGTLTGRVVRRGKIFDVWVTFVAGSTTTFGTGEWSFDVSAALQKVSNLQGLGSVVALDSGTAYKTGIARNSAALSKFSIYTDGGATAWASGVPFTWANGDTFDAHIRYEIKEP